MNYLTEAEAWEVIAQLWHGPETFETSDGLCLSVLELCEERNLDKYHGAMITRIEREARAKGKQACLFYPAGTHRKERAALCRHFAAEARAEEAK